MITEKICGVTEDKLILDGIIYKGKNNRKVIINVHGTAGNFYINEFINSMAKKYTKNGIDFIVFNNRGHDFISEIKVYGRKRSKIIGYAFEDFTKSRYDIKTFVDLAHKLGYKKIILQGHSLGAVKVVYYMEKTRDKRVAGLILASPPDMYGLMKKKEKPTYQKQKLIFIKSSSSKLVISKKTLNQLSKENGPANIFSTYSPKKHSILEKVSIPILAFFGDRSEAVIMNPEKALKIIRNKAKSCKNFTYLVFKGGNHVYYGIEDKVSGYIAKWVNTNFI